VSARPTPGPIPPAVLLPPRRRLAGRKLGRLGGIPAGRLDP